MYLQFESMDFADCIKVEEPECSEYVYCTNDDSETTPVAKKRKKPSVCSSWSHSDISALILAVEQHPCVWEYSSFEYKDRYKREQAWGEIQRDCPGHTVEDCKGKWANVKTVYQNVKKKIKTKCGQGLENTQPHWPYWNSMQFYSRQDIAKTTCSLSTLDEQDTQPCCSTNFSPPEKKKLEPDDLMKRAMKYLESEEDNWHTIGMYLASQMREIAKKNQKAASKLHVQLVKTAIEATLKVEEEEI